MMRKVALFAALGLLALSVYDGLTRAGVPSSVAAVVMCVGLFAANALCLEAMPSG